MAAWRRLKLNTSLSALLIFLVISRHRTLQVLQSITAIAEIPNSLAPPMALKTNTSTSFNHQRTTRALDVEPVSTNVSFEERFAPYFPSSAPLSDFVLKQMRLKKPTWPLKVKTPIFIASLPKSGTSSAWRYFICSGHLAAHTFGRLNQTTVFRLGDRIENNIENDRKPFEGCGHYYVWSDAGTVSQYKDEEDNSCFYPSIHALDALYRAYPEMTILLLRRNVTKWASSVTRYAYLARRWSRCPRDGMPHDGDMEQFYESHSDRLRQFVKDHPSITYVELQLEEGNMGQQMHDAFGGPASCWRHCQPGMKFKDCKVI